MVYPNLLIPDDNPIKMLITVARYLFSLIHLVLWLLLTAEFYFIQLPVLINRRLQEATSIDDRFVLSFVKQNFKSFTFLWATVTESRFLYHVLMVVFSLTGLIYNPGFYSVHLLDFVFRDSILQGVISSITLNIHSISRTVSHLYSHHHIILLICSWSGYFGYYCDLYSQYHCFHVLS